MPLQLVYPYPEHQGWWEIDYFNPEEYWTYEEETLVGDYVEEFDNSRYIAEHRLSIRFPTMAYRINQIHRETRYNPLEKFLVRLYEEALKLEIGS